MRPAIEVTQADRDAAISGYYAWCSGNPVIPNKIASGVADDHSMVQAFARHRIAAAQAERAAVAAWFRHTAECIRKDADEGLWHPLTEDDVQSAIDEVTWYAERIEAGEHHNWRHPKENTDATSD